MRHLVHTAYKRAAEAVMPVRTQSAFKEKGVREGGIGGGAQSDRPLEHLLPTRTHTRCCCLVPLPQVLTPEEFVQAGEYLVKTCPTWAWEGGDAAKAKPFLPAGQQYLITRIGEGVTRWRLLWRWWWYARAGGACARAR